VHPELVRLQLLGVTRPLYSYGLMVILGAATGILVTVARARRYGLPRFDALALGLVGVAGGLCGGTLLSVATHLGLFLARPALLAEPGLVFYGGFLGGLAAAALYCRAYRLSLVDAADAAAPGLALGHALGRVGCLLGGCCYGRVVAPDFPLALPLAGTFRHPVQLYEAAGLVLIAVVLLALRPRRRGALFALYLGGYALLRLGTERFRGDDLERGFVVPGLVSTSQAIAALLLVAAAFLMHRFTTHKGAAE
jgi:phosphatidylglycerol:prolipoprotein diacylglycerol transferase